MPGLKGHHYFGLDIGSSTVRCVVGSVHPDNPTKPSIIGHGESPNLGMRKGSVAHIDDVSDSIAAAVNEAERVSGIQINRATINVNGAGVLGLDSHGVIAIPALNREITEEDCLRVEEAATIMQLPPNREILQVFAKSYSLDGQDNIKDPIGMHGVRLEVDSHIITTPSSNLRSLSIALDKARTAVDHYTVSSIASIEAVLTRNQKESGTLMLDIGAGTSNLAVIEDGEIQHVSVIPVGGINVTNDLAVGLKTDLEIAELVKVKHASLISSPNRPNRLQVEFEGEKHDFSHSEVNMIIEARLEELMELVDKELNRIHRSAKLPGGVVIVGGSAKLPGIAELAKDKLKLPARLGKLLELPGLIESVSDPSYIPAVGLMLMDMLLGEPIGSQATGNSKTRERLTSLSKKLIDKIK
ncbi:MAG TPA: cell division protein FtsA [Candidatus Saccharimonadales bacterium]|nr:cell division protein FtsA [Candidatus Saccharimonadales bacterium]